MNLSKSIIVYMSFTKGMLVSFVSEERIEPAKIGNVAFFEPDIDILPDKFLFPLIKSFCINKFRFLVK